MPTYEYKCKKCDRIFDHFQSMKDEPLKTCQFDDCDGEVERLISAGAGIIFKGSGFYETDYKKKSSSNSSSSSSSTSSSSSNSSPTKSSESKPTSSEKSTTAKET